MATCLFGQLKLRLGVRQPRGRGRDGTAPSAVVKSPAVCRRHAVMLGLTTPVTSSSSRMTEVWSNVSWQTKPPTVHGETMMHGHAEAQADRRAAAVQR